MSAYIYLIEMRSNLGHSIGWDIDTKHRWFGVNGGPFGVRWMCRGGRHRKFSGRRHAVMGADGGQTWPVAQIVHHHRSTMI